MGLTISSFDAALKEHYTDQRVQNMVYKDNPLLAMMAKMEDFTGRNLPVPIVWGNPQNRSRIFATAQAGSSTTNVDAFTLTRVKDYSIATIDNEAMMASEGNKGAFMAAATTEIDGAIHSLTRSVAVSMYRGADGNIGQVLAEPTVAATTTFTVKNTDEVTNYEVGQTLNIWSAKSGGTQRISETGTTDFVVTQVDRSAGTVTTSAAYDANGTIAADDYIFVKGDRGISLSGLSDWVPASAPGATSFFGVDRSVDTRLGGQRADVSALAIEEGLIDGASQLAREGGAANYCFLNYAKYAELEKSLGAKVNYVDLKVNPEVGFRGIVINGPRGPIRVVADQNCPDKTAFMLKLESWKMYSLGKAVQVIDTDGLQLLRQSSSDGVEARYGSYSQVGCNAPGHNSHLTLS